MSTSHIHPAHSSDSTSTVGPPDSVSTPAVARGSSVSPGSSVGRVLALVVVFAVLVGSSLAIAPAAATPGNDAGPTAANDVGATAANDAGTTPANDAETIAGNDAKTTLANGSAPEIVAVYPNPVADGDSGEFVVLRFPTRTDARAWSLSDDESTVSLPNRTLSGRIAVSPDPNVTRNLTDLPVLELAGDIALANGGETVRLTSGNTVAATISYADAPEGERWHQTEEGDRATEPRKDDWRWTPLGATDFAVSRSGPTNVRAFVLPDAPEVPIETLRRADRRILLAGYTFASSRAADALAAAARRGVRVRVLVDAAPVGGLTRREAKLLDSLVARGVEVRVLGGRFARYDFQHAKYAISDDRALVTTENWKPAGTGGRASRGWGVVVREKATADHLAEVFQADAGWRGAMAWSEFRRAKSFEAVNASNGSYPTEFAPKNLSAESANLLVAPDNAEGEIVSLLDSANDSIRVQQVAIGGQKHSLLRATLRAARRGVEVEILLSSAWYVAEDNRALVEWLNGRAEREGLPLEARMANPRGKYEKIHAKGVVVDGEAAVVGSLNWNNHSARANREVAVVLRGREVGSYYAEVFDSDWQASEGGPGGSGANRLPVGLLAGVAVGALAAILYARKEVGFEN